VENNFIFDNYGTTKIIKLLPLIYIVLLLQLIQKSISIRLNIPWKKFQAFFYSDKLFFSNLP